MFPSWSRSTPSQSVGRHSREGGLESEQTLRCRLLADRGTLEIIEPDNVNAPAVAAVVDRAVASAGPDGRAPASGLNQAGATSSAQILREMLETATKGTGLGRESAPNCPASPFPRPTSPRRAQTTPIFPQSGLLRGPNRLVLDQGESPDWGVRAA